ncbi:MAG: phosphoribosyltransferase [Candidatus Levybacteria bacterium]|nr:phosphoribosyltransferase [Candidatus Levybacteria bacterium]
MFQDREEAGKLLAEQLISFKGQKDVIVLGITRGGVVAAKAVAKILKVPLDILVVKKIGSPTNPELAIGAIGPKKNVFWDLILIKKLNLNNYQIFAIKSQKEKEQQKLEEKLRLGKKPLELNNKTVILVDDGIATGATAHVAQKYLRSQKVKLIILAVPVIAEETLNNIKIYFDRVVALEVPREFHAVGQFFKYFPQVEDEEVITILNRR